MPPDIGAPAALARAQPSRELGRMNPTLSVAMFCGSAMGSDPAHAEAAARFGRILADEGVRLVYGGGGVGLMGQAARAAVEAGGQVLGVIPEFLCLPEVVYRAAETRVTGSMHERKAVMFAEADGFVVLPGGVGTIEEIIEILSWTRLGLHSKPVVFVNLAGFWDPLFALIEHTVAQGFTPASFRRAWRSVSEVEDVLPVLRQMQENGPDVALTPLSVT
jgi:uncharacterized protein (TIGR00730 family)